MKEIADLLSKKRLDKYNCDNIEQSIDMHLYNSELSESCYQSLCYIEIILRNKIDYCFSKKYGEDWILDSSFHIGQNKEAFKATVSKIIRNKDNYMDKNKIISELNFGFWTYLFTKDYASFWEDNKDLLQNIYEKYKNPNLSKIASRLNRIRNFRNKVFHYGSLLHLSSKNNPNKIHDMIYAQIKQLDGQSVLDRLKAFDNFNEKYEKVKTLGFLK